MLNSFYLHSKKHFFESKSNSNLGKFFSLCKTALSMIGIPKSSIADDEYVKSQQSRLKFSNLITLTLVYRRKTRKHLVRLYIKSRRTN